MARPEDASDEGRKYQDRGSGSLYIIVVRMEDGMDLGYHASGVPLRASEFAGVGSEEDEMIVEQIVRITADGNETKAEVVGELVRCKDCKHFEYNSVARVSGIPLIVAHEICNRWGDGCKTSENGFCFLGERKESE